MTAVFSIPHPHRRSLPEAAAAPAPGAAAALDQPSRSFSGRLAGRIALITGGGGGMGRSIAQLFVAEGAFVVVADVAESSAKQVADGLGVAAEHVTLDVRSPQEWRDAVDVCSQRFGAPPDILIHAAGVMVGGAVESCSEDDMRFAFDVNVLGMMHGIQAVVPGMRAARQGAIVGITSMGGVTFGVPQLTPYCVSKAAATALVVNAALELGQYGIRANAIVPGQVDTPMSRNAGGPADDAAFARMPVPRMGQPRDIARAALFLASDESSWITGTKFLIDGGMGAGPGLG